MEFTSLLSITITLLVFGDIFSQWKMYLHFDTHPFYSSWLSELDTCIYLVLLIIQGKALVNFPPFPRCWVFTSCVGTKTDQLEAMLPFRDTIRHIKGNGQQLITTCNHSKHGSLRSLVNNHCQQRKLGIYHKNIVVSFSFIHKAINYLFGNHRVLRLNMFCIWIFLYWSCINHT